MEQTTPTAVLTEAEVRNPILFQALSLIKPFKDNIAALMVPTTQTVVQMVEEV